MANIILLFLREKHGYSQRFVAHHMGLDITLYCQLENDELLVTESFASSFGSIYKMDESIFIDSFANSLDPVDACRTSRHSRLIKELARKALEQQQQFFRDIEDINLLVERFEKQLLSTSQS